MQRRGVRGDCISAGGVSGTCSAGALSFLLVWFAFLWLWSIPVILIEYGIGRYTHKAVIESWGTLIGPSYRFLGGFPVAVSFCIA